MFYFVAVGHFIRFGKKTFGKIAETRSAGADVIFYRPVQVVAVVGFCGYAFGAHLHVRHITPHEVEIEVFLYLRVLLADVLPGLFAGA